MCSSRIDHELGVVEITAPGGSLAYPVGMRFVVVGSLTHERMIEVAIRRFSFATWAARLGLPASASAAVVPDPARMAQARDLGLVHESLLEPPLRDAA